MPDNYTFYPPQYSSLNSEEITVDSNVKYKILKTIDPKIVLDEISLPLTRGKEDDQQKLHVRASLEYPLVRINDYTLSENEIEYFNIDCAGFLPKLTIIATFSNQEFIATNMPKDGDIISIVIRNKSDILKEIRNDYVITSASSRDNLDTKGANRITFNAELFVPGLKSKKNNYSFVGTSMEIIQECVKLLNLGFCTNEDNTIDKQIWMCANDSLYNFIQNTTQRSWSNEESFYKCWIDVYYCLNFININKQLMSAEDSIDVNVLLNNLNIEQTWGDLNVKQENAVATPKILSNIEEFKTTSSFINKWMPLNKSSAITFELGTKFVCQFFEHNQKVYNDETLQNFWEIDVDPIYDKDKTKTHILLRGRPKYDVSTNKESPAKANYNYTDIYVSSSWMGVQYTLSNPDDDINNWDGNQHSNFVRAKIYNHMNLKELDKLNLEVTVLGTNLNFIRGDKIPIILIRRDLIENRRIWKDNDPNMHTTYDLFYSGWYIIKDFSISWSSPINKSQISGFRHRFTLARREWPPPYPVTEVKNNTTQNDNI